MVLLGPTGLERACVKKSKEDRLWEESRSSWATYKGPNWRFKSRKRQRLEEEEKRQEEGGDHRRGK